MTTAIQAPFVRLLATGTRQQGANVVKNIRTASSPTSGGRRFAVAAAASRSTKEEANSEADDPTLSFTSQDDDLSFLLKLGGGSFAGAAAIKYGSILVPEITRPNIIQALIMISIPVVVAVLILIKQSRGVRH